VGIAPEQLKGCQLSLESELLEMEQQFWHGSGDVDFWTEHFSDEGVIALSIGLMNKAEVVQSQAQARPWADFSIKDAHVVDLGDDVASITYLATAERHGQPEYSAAVTSVYARRKGDWRLMVHQQTPTEH
jgi:hypothetical protein